MIDLKNFFRPKSIAVIGVSRNPNKVGHVLLKNIIDAKYSGEIYAVNNKADKVLGYKAYKSVLEINKKIDLAIISIPAEFVLQIVKECNKKKIKDLLIVTAGFSEVGNKKAEEELRNFILKNNMRLCGVNCLGILDTHNNFDSLFLPRDRLTRPSPGGISFVCQSGAIGSAILDLATFQGHRFSKFISYGNATTLDESDFIEYLGEDNSTKVICLYLEGVKDGKKFIRVMKKVSSKKPIIAIKGGITEEGHEATLSHTGSLAGNAQVYFGIFKQVGIIHAETLGEMLTYASMFEKSIKPKGNKVQVITNGGGYGILSTDAISSSKNLIMSRLSKKTVSVLRKKLSSLINPRNPLDLLGDADTQKYNNALEACINDKNIDIILLIILYQTPLITPGIVNVVTKFNKLKKKPIITVSTGGKFTEELKKELEKHSIVTTTFPEEAVKGINALVEYYLKK